MSSDGFQPESSASAEALTPVPAMPHVSPETLYRGTPHLLVYEGVRHSLGWQDSRKAGPSFVVTRQRALDRTEVKERFPLTEQGWDSAWRALSGLDPSAAAAIAATLAEREAIWRAKALDASGLSLRRVLFAGGSGDVPLVKGHVYDLRFLDDHVMVSPAFSAASIVEIPYGDVDNVEADGPGRVGMSNATLALLILGLAFLGAVLGYYLVIPRIVGLLFGAVLLGLIGALLGVGQNRIETIIRVRSSDADMYFTCNDKLPHAVRIELAAPLAAIDKARTAREGGLDQQAELASRSIPDQLAKLASLLDRGLISREEFDQLKARLVAKL